jgi:hypothetical protein
VANEEDVYNASGALIQLRRVDEAGAPLSADADDGATPPPLPAPTEDERPSPPRPRQLMRSWLETLYELGVYASA